MAFDVFRLSNGLRVVGERIPGARSVAIGMYVGIGSQFEPLKLNGISHFIEHMVFKGTTSRTARQIAVEMDRIGGEINAYTSHDCTCFYTRTLPKHLGKAIEVVCDLVLHPAFSEADIEKEKGVVAEEISMAEDDPEDLVHELLIRAHYGRQAISRPILGTQRRLNRFSREDIIDFHRRIYCPSNAVFSIAGDFDISEVRTLLERYTDEWKGKQPVLRTNLKAPVLGTEARNRATEQTHICLGFTGMSAKDPDSLSGDLISAVYGEEMSSRLFQRIREELGLAYSIYSEVTEFIDCGMLSVYAATGSESVERVYDEILEMTRVFARDGMTRAEFDMAKEQLAAEIILGGEAASSRMQDNGWRVLHMGSPMSDEDVLKQLDTIEFDKVNSILKRMLQSEHSLVVVGRNARGMAEQLRLRQRS